MNLNLLKYIGDSARRILTHSDLQNLGATGEDLKSLSENTVLTFVKDGLHDVEAGLAKFIANHPALSAEFHLLSDDEAAATQQPITNPVSEGAAPASTEPAGTTPAENTVPTVTPDVDPNTSEVVGGGTIAASGVSAGTTETPTDTPAASA